VSPAIIAAVFIALSFLAAQRPAVSVETPAGSTPEIESTACLDCHDAGLAGTAHDVGAKERVACVSCHQDVTSAHIDDPEAHPARNPRALRADSLIARCTTCHAHPHATNYMERDPHETAGLSCVACHKVHDNHREGLLADVQLTLCQSCHPSTRADFARPSRHPVPDGVMECSDCHMVVDQSKKQHTGSGPGEVCVTCHAMFQGPFPFEHQAAVEYSAQDGGCLNCHQPHGSAHPRLLKQSYEPPTASLCLQCHSVPGHLFNVNHGNAFANIPCNECHVDIHGSYESRRFFDPALRSEGCFNGTCHEF
jgi:DmsE family decaheme c-type cytochrome